MKQTFCWLLITFCIVIGLTGCENQRSSIPRPPGTSQVQLSPTGSDMTDVARTTVEFYEAVKKQNYTLAFSYLDTSAHTTDGQKLTPIIFTQLARIMDSQEGPVVNYAIAAFPPVVVMTITRKGMGPYHTHLQMKQEENGWKILSLDRI